MWLDRLELEHDNLWAALTYASVSRDSGIAARLASLAWYFTLAERVTEGRRFVELALAEASDDLPSDRRLTRWAFSASSRPRLDLDAAIEIGERALAVAATGADAVQVGLAQATLALAVAGAGDVERGAALAEQARATLEASPDHWAFAVASLLRAHIAATVGDASTVAAMAADAHRHADAIEFDAFRVPAMLLDAWVAERHNDRDAATDAFSRALELAVSAGFADHVAFALSGLASCALARGTCATPKSSSGARSQPLRERVRSGLPPCSRRARPHPRNGRRHRYRRDALPERARMVRAAAPTRAAGEPLRRARGRPGRRRFCRPGRAWRGPHSDGGRSRTRLNRRSRRCPSGSAGPTGGSGLAAAATTLAVNR